jgi:hypothetical protein
VTWSTGVRALNERAAPLLAGRPDSFPGPSNGTEKINMPVAQIPATTGALGWRPAQTAEAAVVPQTSMVELRDLGHTSLTVTVLSTVPAALASCVAGR